MAIQKRRFKESPWEQGEDESIPHIFSAEPWGATEEMPPENPVTVIKDEDGEDVSEECLSGESTVSGVLITTSTIHSLVRDKNYRLEVLFTIGTATFEAYGVIKAKE